MELDLEIQLSSKLSSLKVTGLRVNMSVVHTNWIVFHFQFFENLISFGFQSVRIGPNLNVS